MLRVSAADGFPLAATVFGAGARGPAVILNGAMGVPQTYYAGFAGFLAERGLTAVTYDYRGIGASRPRRLRGFPARARDWGQLDFEGVLRFASQELGARPLCAVGHSIGGQILGLAPSNLLLRRAVTVCAQSGHWRHWPWPARFALAGLWWGLLPAVAGAVGFLPGRLGVGEDVPGGVASEWARWGRHRDYLFGDGLSADGYQRLAIPILSFSFSDDRYAPRLAVDWLHQRYARAMVQRRHVVPAEEGLGPVKHFGFFRERFRATLWTEAAEFLAAAG